MARNLAEEFAAELAQTRPHGEIERKKRESE